MILEGDAVLFDDGVQRTRSETLRDGLEDLHARADGVWVVGYYGAQILTDVGWCEVLVSN